MHTDLDCLEVVNVSITVWEKLRSSRRCFPSWSAILPWIREGLLVKVATLPASALRGP